MSFKATGASQSIISVFDPGGGGGDVFGPLDKNVIVPIGTGTLPGGQCTPGAEQSGVIGEWDTAERGH